MSERVQRVKDFWSRMAEEAGDEVSAIDRTEEGVREDIGHVLKTLPVKPDFKALDICCGNGLVSLAISDKVRRVIGVDISSRMLERAKRISRDTECKNVDFINGEVVSLPFKDDTFDITLCLTSFHYFPDYGYAEGVLREIFRVTKDSGAILLTDIPSRDSIWYHIWDIMRYRGTGKAVSLPARSGARGLGERVALLLRRFTMKNVDSDEWLWYGKDFFNALRLEKFGKTEIFPSHRKGMINYRFDVLISN